MTKKTDLKIRHPEQAKEITEIAARLGVAPVELAARVHVKPDTMRKYAKGYQPASERFMEMLRGLRPLEVVVATHPDSDHSPRELLKAALVRQGMTTAKLAKRIKYDAGVVEYVINGGGGASEKMIETIIQEVPELELTKDELMAGSDAPLIISEDGLTGSHRAKPSIVLPSGMKGSMIPLLSTAQAGAWDADHDDSHWDGESIFALNVDDRRAFAIRVNGNSMETRLFEGDVVVCSPKAPLKNGECAVVRTKSGQAFIKYWSLRDDVVSLESANPAHSTLKFPRSEIAGAWAVIQTIASGKIRKG